TVTAGATMGNTAAVAVATANAFVGSVTLSCTLTTPAAGANASYYPACGMPSPSAVTLSSTTTSVSSTITFSSTARSTTTGLANPQTKPRTTPWYTAAGGAALACVLFFGIPARRRGWKSMLGLLVFLVAMAGVGCGGGGGNNNKHLHLHGHRD